MFINPVGTSTGSCGLTIPAPSAASPPQRHLAPATRHRPRATRARYRALPPSADTPQQPAGPLLGDRTALALALGLQRAAPFPNPRATALRRVRRWPAASTCRRHGPTLALRRHSPDPHGARRARGEQAARLGRRAGAEAEVRPAR